MVHSDLKRRRRPLRDERPGAVVDIEAAGRGYAVYDLLSPAVNGVSWSADPRAVDHLVRYGLAEYGPGPVAMATACLLGETTAWYQHSDPDHVEQRARRHVDWLDELRPRLV